MSNSLHIPPLASSWFAGVRAHRDLVAFAVLLVALAFSPRAVAQIDQISQSAELLVQQATSPDYATFPRALAFDVDGGGGLNTRKIFVGWTITQDDPSVLPVYRWKSSADLGATYSAVASAPPTDFCDSIKRRDGTLVSVPWRPVYPSSPGTTFTFSYFTSSDNGANWITHTGGVISCGSTTVDGMRFHRGIIDENDGSLYGAAYANRPSVTGDDSSWEISVHCSMTSSLR